MGKARAGGDFLDTLDRILSPSSGPDDRGWAHHLGPGITPENSRKRLRTCVFFYVLTLFIACPGCTGGTPEGAPPEPISRESFIEAYVELRMAALGSPGEQLALEERDRILEEMGLVEEDLLNFVESRGRDVQFMRRVWEEVDSVISNKRRPPDAPGQRGTP